MDAVLSVRFETTLASGRLFVFDKPKMTSDDLVLGEIVARQVAHCFGEFYTVRRADDPAIMLTRAGLPAIPEMLVLPGR